MPLPQRKRKFNLTDVEASEYYVIHKTPAGLSVAQVEELMPITKRLKLDNDDNPDKNEIRKIYTPLILEWNLVNTEESNFTPDDKIIDNAVIPIPLIDFNSWGKIPEIFANYIIMELVFAMGDAYTNYTDFQRKRKESSTILTLTP